MSEDDEDFDSNKSDLNNEKDYNLDFKKSLKNKKDHETNESILKNKKDDEPIKKFLEYKKEYNKNYHKEKRIGVYKQLEKLTEKLDGVIDLIRDKTIVNIEFQGEEMEWTINDIKSFIKSVGEIAEDKYNKNINKFNQKDQQRYYRLDKYRQALESLKW
jgi:hypothetical protein